MRPSESFSTDSETHLTLLGEFINQVDDSETTRKFLDRYRYLFRHHLGPILSRSQDYPDLEQNILLRIIKGLKKFERQRTGSFRKWLKMVVKSVQADWFAAMVREKKIQFLSAEQIEAQVESFATDFQEEHDLDMMAIALDLVRKATPPEVWSIFEQFKIEQRNAQEVAENHGVTPQVVYKTCQRLLSKIRATLKLLEQKQWRQP